MKAIYETKEIDAVEFLQNANARVVKNGDLWLVFPSRKLKTAQLHELVSAFNISSIPDEI